MAEKDTLDIVCEAVDLIVENRLSGLAFDKTIQCTIVDDSKSSEGEYVVSDGSTKFKAYSENTKYRNNTHVYVTVPMGDFNQKKIITGKYVSSDSQSATWVSPMESFVELAPIGSWSGDMGLLANNGSENKGTSIELTNFTMDAPGVAGYDRLGISADFQTHLKQFNTIAGSYGLLLYLTCQKATTAESGEESIETKVHTLMLDSSDMWGNPYNFEGWFTQEKVWDISKLGTITNVKVYFYQAGNFIDNEEKPIPYSYEMGNNIEKLPDNIFVNNLKISAGHSLDDMTEDKIYLLTYNSKTYRPRSEEEIQQGLNDKEVQLRWVHKVGDRFVVIDNDKALKEYVSGKNIETQTAFYWYRKVVKNEVTDDYAGNFWRKEMLDKDQDFWVPMAEESFWKRIVRPDILLQNEKIKVIIRTTDRIAVETAEAAKVNAEEVWQEVQQQFEKESDEYKKAEENYKIAIDTYNEEVSKARTFYYSEELEFTNETNTEQQKVDLVKALKLVYPEKDSYKGIYRIYDGNTKKVLTPRETNTNRTIIATYESLVTGETFLDGTGAESITWKIPLEKTMIQEPVAKVSFTEEEEKDNKIVWKKDGYLYIKREVESAKNEDGSLKTDIKNPELIYRIKEYYSPEYNNNTIYCSVIKNNLEYEAEITPTFGVSGTMGTDYTIDLRITDEVEFDEQGNEIIVERSVAAVRADMARSRWVKIEAKLYDHENKPVENTSFSWNWFNRKNDSDWKNQNTKSAFIFKSDTTGPVNYIQWKENAETNGVPIHTVRRSTENILEISTEVKDSITYDLKAYLPIPSKMDASVKYLEGATTIVYNSSGSNPEWYKKSYVLHHDKTIAEDEQIIINIKPGYNEIPIGWEKAFNKENFGIEYSFRPGVDNTTQTIKPGPMYIHDINMIYWVLVGFKKADSNAVDENRVLWSQPLYIGQNLYESSLLNQWDGNLTIDENNGTILSTMVGAGRKNKLDNTFSGVLMGDIGEATGINKTGLGLYGFHQGAQSFGLNIDGTAFFGKSGKGRINLNGNKATLESADYATNKNGMIIDLDDGFIKTNNWQINTDGSAVFKNIKASNGTGNSSLDWGNGFSVDTGGILRANGAIISGDIYCNYLEAITGGKIGGWTINSGSLSGGGCTLNSNGTINGGTITGSNLNISHGNGYLRWRSGDSHPTVSGLNVGDGGIQAGGKGCAFGWTQFDAGFNVTGGNIQVNGYNGISETISFVSGVGYSMKTVDGSGYFDNIDVVGSITVYKRSFTIRKGIITGVSAQQAV